MAGDVRINIQPFMRFTAQVRNTSGPIRTGLRQSGAIYLGFVRRRYVRNSRGGGDWPGLSPVTIKRRRRGNGSGSKAILRDTGTLLGALTRGGRGNQFRDTRRGVVVGYGGSGSVVRRRSRGKGGGGGATSTTSLADLAGIHNFGRGHIPQRQIIAEPDAQTLNQITQSITRGLVASLKQQTS